METGLLRLETEKITYDTKYASSAPFGQTTESPASLPLSTDCPSCPSDYLPQTRQPDSHHMIFVYVLFPRPGMLFPSLLAKAAPLFSPKIQQKRYLFRASSPWPIPDCLPSHNHIDYSLVFIPTGHWGLRLALLCGLSPHEDVIHRGREERVLWSLFCFPVPSPAPSLY